MTGSAAEIGSLIREMQNYLMKELRVKHVRLNVMTPKTSKLQMIAHTDGFDREEVKISLSKGQGCSGKAWNTKQPSISDLAKDVHWISTEDQKRVKSGLKVILAIPLFDPDFPKLQKVIGTVTIDSVEPIYDQLKNSESLIAPFVRQLETLVKQSGL